MAKRKNKGGRPSKFNEDTVRKLEWALSIGASIKESASFAGISRETLYEWRRLYEGFSDRIRELQALPVLQARKVMYDAVMSGNVRVALWFLERKRPEEFGRFRKVAGMYDHKAEDDSPPLELVRFVGGRRRKRA